MATTRVCVGVGLLLALGCSADSDQPMAGQDGLSGASGTGLVNPPVAGAGGAGTTATAGTGAAGMTSSAGTGAAGMAAGAAGTAGSAAGASGGTPQMDAGPPVDDTPFSFFVTSLEAMRRLSGSQDGFGGNLGGLEGADGICQEIAAGVGAGHKTWRAFLSATTGGPNGGPVHAIERIGQGPWYDRNGRLVANDVAGLLQVRPDGDPQTVDDLPDENGVPLSTLGDSHDILTGSDAQGRLASTDPANTCQDWTSAQGEGSGDMIMCGHSWPRCADPMFGGMFGGCDALADGGMPSFFGGGPGGPGGPPGFSFGSNWLSDHPVHGCAPGVNLVQSGAGDASKLTVGEGGGYGAIYCFALTP